LDLAARWQGGELDRLLNARHSTLHDRVAAFLAGLADWIFAPEVSFAVYGERGVIDVLAWHSARRALLVVELKTDIVDVQELIGTLDRKRRLGGRIARERGWSARTVGVWLVVSGTKTNRRHVAAHGHVLRAAFPAGRSQIRGWLADPRDSIAALSFWPHATSSGAGPAIAAVRRVRRRSMGPRTSAIDRREHGAASRKASEAVEGGQGLD
jgi:hypothetical protein